MGWLKREAAAAEHQRAMAALLAQAGRAAGTAVQQIEAGARKVRTRAFAAALSRPDARSVASDPVTSAEFGVSEEAERLALLMAAAQAAIRAIDQATQAVIAMQQIGRADHSAATQRAPVQCAPAQCASVTTAFGFASSSTSGTARKKTPAMSSSTSL
jgi:hypothetical protein